MAWLCPPPPNPPRQSRLPARRVSLTIEQDRATQECAPSGSMVLTAGGLLSKSNFQSVSARISPSNGSGRDENQVFELRDYLQSG